MPRLDTQEIVNGAIGNALECAQKVSDPDARATLMAQIRSQEAIAHALVGLELAVKEAGSQVSDVGPALENIAVQVGGMSLVSR